MGKRGSLPLGLRERERERSELKQRRQCINDGLHDASGDIVEEMFSESRAKAKRWVTWNHRRIS
jgi:hypothetical protein